MNWIEKKIKNLCDKNLYQRNCELHQSVSFYRKCLSKNTNDISLIQENMDLKSEVMKMNNKIKILEEDLEIKWSDEKEYILRLKNNLRTRLYLFCKSKGFNSNLNTTKMLGMDLKEFKKYIEKMFVEGMTWDNYGTWHLDHIIPLVEAKDEKTLYTLNHYTNFQPLWAKDNLIKHCKMVIS